MDEKEFTADVGIMYLTTTTLPPPPSSSSSSCRHLPPPPHPAPAAIPFTDPQNSSGDPSPALHQSGSGHDYADDPSSAPGGTVVMVNEDVSPVPMQETNPASMYTPTSDTPETPQEEDCLLLDNTETERDGEGVELEEVEQGVPSCTGDNEAHDNTTK